jgi:hypothetical protein
MTPSRRPASLRRRRASAAPGKGPEHQAIHSVRIDDGERVADIEKDYADLDHAVLISPRQEIFFEPFNGRGGWRGRNKSSAAIEGQEEKRRRMQPGRSDRNSQQEKQVER